MTTKNNSYMVVLYEKSLKADYIPFEEGLESLYKYIDCDCIDHSSAIDDLNERHIDMWLDDEGLLKSRCPVFVFLDNEDNVTGQIVGNVVFQKSNNEGESYGLTLEEVQQILYWLHNHDVVSVELYNGVVCPCYVIRPYETEVHRQKISDMVKWAKDNGFAVM